MQPLVLFCFELKVARLFLLDPDTLCTDEEREGADAEGAEMGGGRRMRGPDRRKVASSPAGKADIFVLKMWTSLAKTTHNKSPDKSNQRLRRFCGWH